MYVYDEEIEQFVFQLSDDRCQISQTSPYCHWTLMRSPRLVAHLRAYCTVCTYLCLEADFASHPSIHGLLCSPILLFAQAPTITTYSEAAEISML